MSEVGDDANPCSRTASTIVCLTCTLTGNGTAVKSSAGSIIRLSNNDIFNNGTGNNRKAGNATPGAPNAAIAVQ